MCMSAVFIHPFRKAPKRKKKPKNKTANKTGYRLLICNPLILLVGAVGFELTTLCSQSRCATRLRYAPKTANIPEIFCLG